MRCPGSLSPRKRPRRQEAHVSIEFLRKDNPLNPSSQDRYVEIDEQTQMESSRFEVRDHLSFVDRSEGLDRLQLDKEFGTYEQVDSPLANILPLVAHGNRPLPFKRDPAERQFDYQSFFIDAF